MQDLHTDFYEKAFFVKPTWRLYIRGRAQRLPLATLLCALLVSLLLGGSVHYEIRLLGPRDKALQSSERSSWKVETKSIWRSHLIRSEAIGQEAVAHPPL